MRLRLKWMDVLQLGRDMGGAIFRDGTGQKRN